MRYELSLSENGKNFISEKGNKKLEELIGYCDQIIVNKNSK